MLSASCGVLVTVTASVKLTVTVTTSSTLSVLFCMPVALLMARSETVGAVVSTVTAVVILATAVPVCTLPAASVSRIWMALAA